MITAKSINYYEFCIKLNYSSGILLPADFNLSINYDDTTLQIYRERESKFWLA